MLPPSPSVHHLPYPAADETLIDTALSAEMDALLGLVTLGSAARNQVKIKVRQPLAEVTIQPGSDVERRAVERFADQICEELNIKKVTIHDPAAGPLLRLQLKPNPKNLGPKKVNLKAGRPGPRHGRKGPAALAILAAGSRKRRRRDGHRDA